VAIRGFRRVSKKSLVRIEIESGSDWSKPPAEQSGSRRRGLPFEVQRRFGTCWRAVGGA
jgi:hypothetical protein